MTICPTPSCGAEIPDDHALCEACRWRAHKELCRSLGIADVQGEWERQTKDTDL